MEMNQDQITKLNEAAKEYADSNFGKPSIEWHVAHTAFKAGYNHRDKELDGWVSVEERLPEDKKTVLAWSGSQVVACSYNKVSKTFERYSNSIDGDRCYNYVYSNTTYWQPLPNPPSVIKKGCPITSDKSPKFKQFNKNDQ